MRRAAVDFLVFWVLWMAFVSKAKPDEAALGAAAALLACLGSRRARGPRPQFRARWRRLGLGFRVPWYALTGTAAIFAALAERLAGKRPAAGLKALPFAGERRAGSRGAGARALATLYLTIPPSTIVIGVDNRRGVALIHQLGFAGTGELGRRLGVGA